MITIGKTYITQDDDRCYLNSNITTDTLSCTLWFSTKSLNKASLCLGRADAFAAAILSYAMRTGDTVRCEDPLSERLYFQLTEYLIPMMSENNERYKKIKLEAAAISEPYQVSGITGRLKRKITASKINIRFINGSANQAQNGSVLKTLSVDTNCSDIFHYTRHEEIFLSQTACILSLQGILSGCVIQLRGKAQFSNVSLSDDSFIIFSLNCISTETITFMTGRPDNIKRRKKRRDAIHIGAPYIEEHADGSCLCARVIKNDREEVFWFKVDCEYGKYLTADRSDAFLAALLTTAMREKKDIICEAPVTENILCQVNNYLIPLMSKNIQYYNRIAVIAEPIKALTNCAGAVGTGCTCGVDSMLTIMEHSTDQSSCFRLTHLLCVCNGSIEGENAHDTLKKMSDKMKSGIGAEIGLPVISIDSDLHKVLIGDKFILAHSFRHTAVTLALQKFFRANIWSSGHHASQFCFDEYSDGYYELAVYNCFNTGCTSLYSSGSAYTRMEKLKLLSGYPAARRFLHPCIYALRDNDSRCDKCVRTMLGLYCLGTLDRFSSVFNVEGFKQNKEWYFKRLSEMGCNNDACEILNELRRQGADIQFTVPLRQGNIIKKILCRIFG